MFFFNDTATTEIYTLSLHDALPILVIVADDEDRENEGDLVCAASAVTPEIINFMAKEGRGLICLALTAERAEDRKSTRLNSSYANISYAVFCLKKKNVAY